VSTTTPSQALRSITERINCLTTEIDLASPLGIVRQLRQSDAQLFAGWGGHPSLSDEETLLTLALLASRTGAVLHQGGRVVMAGAGTSGRLAAFAARAWNGTDISRPDGSGAATADVDYIMAGGPAALIQAQEGAEDDAVTGRAELIAAAQDKPVIYIGITCGFSAPYVAGQLEAVLDGTVTGEAILLGFNPPELARRAAVEGWSRTFGDVVDDLLKSDRGHLLNPIVGPEPITGSTRMKGGSATKILLEVLLDAACRVACGALPAANHRHELIPGHPLRSFVEDALSVYHQAVIAAYEDATDLARVVEIAGNTLRKGGTITYVGAIGDETQPGADSANPTVRTEAGILGLIDASECPPTYGASFDSVRGYLPGGWASLLPGSSVDLTAQGDLFRFDIVDFRNNRMPHLGARDLTVLLGALPNRAELIADLESHECTTALITWDGATECQPSERVHFRPLRLDGPPSPSGKPRWINHGPTQLTLKLLLNAITTGGHVLAGKVYGNRMVDLRISNNKLFFRTLGIIQDLMGVDEPTARRALLRSVHGIDGDASGNLPAEIEALPVSAHIEASKSVEKLVPRALLLATGKFNIATATEALRANPIVRAVLADLHQ
jgi:N-acetylmuramic acid 6-phosphate (MurNAc-6-P) etherase